LKTGCQWEFLPVQNLFSEVILHYKTVFGHFRKWCKDSKEGQIFCQTTCTSSQNSSSSLNVSQYMEKLVTIMTFTHPSEMYVIRWRLEMEGIDCFAKDELTIQIHPFYSNALGGVKLQIRERDLEKATAILKESGYIQEKMVETEKMKDTNKPPVNTDSRTQCPSCGSEEISAQKRPGYVFVFSFLLLGFPLPFLKKNYHCFDCGLNFKK
jgi:hypothetical protein